MKKFFSFVVAALAAMTMSAEDITCAAAVTAGNALGDNVTDSTTLVSVVGYVSIAEAWKEASKQQIFYMADDSASTSKAFEAYYCNTEVAIKRGDKVRVTGYLTKYVPSGGTPQVEIKNGDVVVLQAAEEVGPQEIKLYTVSEVIAAYDNGTLIEGDSCMVVGVISKWYAKSSKFDQYHSVSYFITDGEKEFEMYNSYSVNNALYATYEYVDENTATCIDENGLEYHIGDSVIGIGTVKKYYDTYEFNQNCYLVWTNAKAGEVPVDNADVTFTPADFEGQGQEATLETPGGEVSTTKDGVTVATNNGFGHNLALRVYKGAQFNITSAEKTIRLIKFKFYSTYDGGMATEYHLEDANEWENPSTASQARIEKIQIYFSWPESIENVELTEKAQKVMVDGVMYIVRDGKMFDVRGAQVR